MNRNGRKWWRTNKHKLEPARQNSPSPYAHLTLSKETKENLQTLQDIYSKCSDVIFRPFYIGKTIKAHVVFISGLCTVQDVDQYVLTPLMQANENEFPDMEQMAEQVLAVSRIKNLATIADCIEEIGSGNPVLLWEGEERALSLGLAKWEKRNIEEPSAEVGIRGPREGFTETLDVNTSQIRRRIKDPALKMERMKIGGYTQTEVIVAYMEGIVDQTLVEEAKARLNRIQIDGILESGYIEEMIEDNPASPFPQLKDTERPDTACSALLEGRVVILVDGTPFALIAPVTFFALFQAAEDYYQRYIISTAIRWLRYLFLGISLLLPSLYVAIITFHQEMVPTSLLISMAASREAVPFPGLVEALLMEITFEALREAGVRLPKQIGAAVSIVGALVIGQAAVDAGLVSAPMVIVVAITGIANFMVPRYSVGTTVRLLRFPIMFLAGTLGLLGVMLGLIAIVVHLCTLRSFGVPYLSGISPLKPKEWKDILYRSPWWAMKTRPHFTGEFNQYRQAPDQKPGPERSEDP